MSTAELDDLGGAGPAKPPPPERRPGEFARHPRTGAPYVASLDATRKRQGNKADLVRQAVELGLEVPDKITVAGLHDLLGPEPKLVTYGRPSSLGKRIEDGTALSDWRERRVVLGFGINPELRGRARALVDLELDGDAFREAANRLAAEAKEAAGAHLAAERGTHHHGLTEDLDLERDPIARMAAGEELGVPRHVQEALLAAWALMLAEAGLEVLAVEATVVDDEWRLAGTLDRVVRLTRDLTLTTVDGDVVTLPAGLVIVLDVKTGKLRLDKAGLVTYWHSYAVQVASYAKSVPYDPDTDRRGEWSWPIDQRWALIAHLDVLAALETGKAICRLVPVDLEAGRHGGALCCDAKAWERRTDLFGLIREELVFEVDVEAPPAPTAVEVDEAFAGLPDADAPDPLTVATDEARAFAPPGTVNDRYLPAALAAELDPAPIREALAGALEAMGAPAEVIEAAARPDPATTFADPGRRAWVLERLADLKANPAAVATMTTLWPAGVPGTNTDHAHTVAELDAIIAALDETDRQHAGDLTPDPLHRGRTYRVPAEPPEGFGLGKAQIADVVEAYEELGDADKARFGTWLAEAAAAGVSWSLAERKTSRRAAVYRAAFALLRLIDGDDYDDLARATVRAVCEGALADGFTLAAPLGVALGRITAEQARRIKELAPELAGGDAAALMYDDDGAPRWTRLDQAGAA